MPRINVLPTSLADAQSAGVLLGESAGDDVVDALLAAQVLPGDQVLTSDPDDLRHLLAARGVDAVIVRV